MEIKFQKISDFAVCPSRNTETDAGYDLYSTTSYSINPLERKLISTGIKIHIPEGYYGRIAPRSGLAVRKGLDVMAGVIDSGYRGELKVLLVNITPYAPSKTPYENFFGTFGKIDIKQGDRIAQMIIVPVAQVNFEAVDDFEISGRGEKGYHSRSGSKHRPWFEGGQMPIHRRLPKRGFSNYLFRKQYQIVNLRDVDALNLDEIDSKELFDNGLISSFLQPVKVLGDGELKKAIKIKASSFSKSAISKIEKAGGTIEIQ